MFDLCMIKGVGEKTEKILNKLNIYNIMDLVTYYPFRYEVLKKTSLDGEKVVISGKIVSTPLISYFKKMNKLSFRLDIDNNIINVVIFNRGFLKNNLNIGKDITVIGKYDREKNTLTASDIRLYDIGNKVTIEPIYHLTKGITNKSLNTIINNSLDSYNIIDYIPEKLVNKYNFISKEDSIYNMHNPDNTAYLKNSIIRTKYEELFLFMLKINALKFRNNEVSVGYKKDIDRKKIETFISNLPFNLTIDQLKALDEIFSDLESDRRMNRLIQGDVGSGKTIVSIISMYALYLCGYQSALMAPTEVLARQHFENINKLFKDYGINVCLLLGNTKKSEKKKIYEKIENGIFDIIIGTHSLITEDIKYNNLGLVITDEQHRFGVNQRNSLRNKGNIPDVLYMSATPIPRTYALTIYGDMDISIIKTMPSGRKKIITEVFAPDDIKTILYKIKSELDLGHQIYIVSPLIEGSEDESEDISKLDKKFKLAFKNYNIGVMHGRLNPKEKENIMNEFLDKKIDILISTTVIEVGVDVKNAGMIVIFDAYKFGLATLHQLRGRVGRNDFQSYCILVSSKDSKRLEIMKETNDGFVLAEEDLKLRGYGDLFGVKQSGDMTFKLANLTKDYKMLIDAKSDSLEILKDIDKYQTLKNILSETINMD